MNVEQVIRDAVVMLSFGSIGAALFTATLCMRMRRANVKRYTSFALAKLGYALTVGTVLLRVLPDNTIPFDKWSAAYLAGLSFAGVGFAGVGRVIRREFVDWESARDEETRNGNGVEHIVIHAEEDDSGEQPAP